MFAPGSKLALQELEREIFTQFRAKLLKVEPTWFYKERCWIYIQ